MSKRASVLLTLGLLLVCAWAFADEPRAPAEPPSFEGETPEGTTVRPMTPEERRAFGNLMIGELRARLPRPNYACLAPDGDEEGEDFCTSANRISRSKPCLAGRDCPAVEEWQKVMGSMGIRWAPEVKTTTIRIETFSEPEEPAEEEAGESEQR